MIKLVVDLVSYKSVMESVKILKSKYQYDGYDINGATLSEQRIRFYLSELDDIQRRLRVTWASKGILNYRINTSTSR